MNRYFALAYLGGTAAFYLLLASFAGIDVSKAYVFTWWHPALAAFVGGVAIIPPAIYLGSRAPDDCRDCVKAARKYARLETERDELKQALLALEPPK